MTTEEQIAAWCKSHVVRRYGISMKRYTTADLYALDRGEPETTRYAKVNGLILPVRYDSGRPEVDR